MSELLQLKEITSVARTSASDGNTAANLMLGTTGALELTQFDTLNTIVNSNRIFINSFASISNLDCSTDQTAYNICTKVSKSFIDALHSCTFTQLDFFQKRKSSEVNIHLLNFLLKIFHLLEMFVLRLLLDKCFAISK